MADIPIIRAYLALECATSDLSASLLDAFEFQIDTDKKHFIYHKISQSKETSFRPAFISKKIGFNLLHYNLEKFNLNTNHLFNTLIQNSDKIVSLTETSGISAHFIVNINSMNIKQRPYYFLDANQLQLLASFRASISYDCYLMFPTNQIDEQA